MTITIQTLDEIYKNPQFNDTYAITAIVDSIFRREDGLNIFNIYDGTQYFKLVNFVKNTVLFPEVAKGSVVKAEFSIKEYNGELEGTPKKLQVVDETTRQKVKEQIQSRTEEQYAPTHTTPLLEGPGFKKLNEKFVKMATLIRKSLLEKRPILITHHADCDGYTAGFLLEQAIKDFNKDESQHNSSIITRVPSRPPFYELTDATRDIGFFVTRSENYDYKKPLILIVDNGSTQQDLMAIKKVQLFGATVAVIDHHDPGTIDENGESETCKVVKEHVNPHLVGEGNGYSASLLMYTIAYYISGVKPNAETAILGAVSDRSQVPELQEMIRQSGKEREYFETLTHYVDYEIFLTKSQPEYTALKELLFGTPERRQEIINVYKEDLERQRQEVKDTLSYYHVSEQAGQFKLFFINGDETTLRGEFFSIGKQAGIAHDMLTDKLTKAITIAYTDTLIVYRATQEEEIFDGNTLRQELKKKLPHARISGGGHGVAGSIMFVKASKEEVLKEVQKYISSL